MKRKKTLHSKYKDEKPGALIMRRFIVIFLITLFITGFFPERVSAVLLDRVVAVVNSEVITWSELRSMVEREGRILLEGLSGDERDAKIQEVEKQFLSTMIDIKLQLQEARRQGLSVQPEETEGAIIDIKSKYGLSDEAFFGSLAQEGLSIDDYRKELSDQILISKLTRQNINSAIFISGDEIQRYYEDNKEDFRAQESVKIRQILLIGPPDESMKPDIDARASEIMRRIREGEDFAELAKSFSEGPSREFGGDLGYITRGSVLREVEERAFGLETGAVSDPFWSSSGLHIIKLENRRGGVQLDDVKNEIQKALYKDMFQSRYEDWIKALREKAYIEINL
jgi:peptidyl-prolyl cis-trans isomerase SurA